VNPNSSLDTMARLTFDCATAWRNTTAERDSTFGSTAWMTRTFGEALPASPPLAATA
jgi:hypothetical protein